MTTTGPPATFQHPQVDQIKTWLDQNFTSYFESAPVQMQAKQILGGKNAGFCPTGTVVDYAASSAPQGWVLCDGSTYDGTNPLYLNLWAVIGTTYGGSGQSAFQVPDTRGRVVAGYAASGGHLDVSTLGLHDGSALANRRPTHNTSSGTLALSSVSAGTPAGTINSVSAGTPAGTVSSVSAGTPAGTVSVSLSDPGHTHGIQSNNFAAGSSNCLDRRTDTGNTTYTSDSNTTGITVSSATFTGSAMSTHGHTFSGSALATHNHTFTGSAMGAHTHTLSGTIGPSGTNPTDTPAYLVLAQIIKL